MVPKKLSPKVREQKSHALQNKSNDKTSHKKSLNSATPRLSGEYVIPSIIETTSIPITSLKILLFGETGVGKSSFFSHFDGVFYIRYEGSSRFIKARKSPVLLTWEDTLTVLMALEKNANGVKYCVTDTGAPCFDRCLEYVSKQLDIPHPGAMKDYGFSWGEVRKMWQQYFNWIDAMGMGSSVVCHEDVQPIETRSGGTYSRIQPNLSGKSLEFMKGYCDIIGYYFVYAKERFLLIEGQDHIMAKCNCEDNFLTPSGKRISCIPMGTSSQEAFSNFNKAFNNQQSKTYEEVLAKGGLELIPHKKLQKSEVTQLSQVTPSKAPLKQPIKPKK